jgi:type II secretory ATPase GspE/PulE/Tfp pilus assembly ATPase PilB-like protein
MAEQIKKGSLGDILSASQIISQSDITAALEEQIRSGCRIGEALVKLGIVTQEDIDWALCNQLDLPYVRLKLEMIDPEAIRLVPAALARKFNLIPLIKVGNELNIAIADPLNLPALEAVVALASGCQINLSVALLREIREMIDACYGSAGQEALGFESSSFDAQTLDTINADLSGAQLLECLLFFIHQNQLASLSLQPLGDRIAISGRRSGVTRQIGQLAPNYYPDITLKIRKRAGITPNSDHSSAGLLSLLQHGHELRFQVAVMAGIGGDYITIRRHVTAGFPDSVPELNLTDAVRNNFTHLARARRGITFFASHSTPERNRCIDLMLAEMDTNGRNVLILGEGAGGGSFPRIHLPESEHERGRTVMEALEHEPDVLVIENATEGVPFSAACRAAMRGTLVLAGLEIRGTRNVLQQLLLYQQKGYFLPFFVNGLIAFKGIQLLCPECRSACTPSTDELLIMSLEQPPATFFRSGGCEVCAQSGISTRRFLMDILLFDEEFHRVFEQSRDVDSLEQHLRSIGYRGTAEDGLQLLMDGLVSPEEYIAALVL